LCVYSRFPADFFVHLNLVKLVSGCVHFCLSSREGIDLQGCVGHFQKDKKQGLSRNKSLVKMMPGLILQQRKDLCFSKLNFSFSWKEFLSPKKIVFV